MVGISERLRSEPLPGGERHIGPAPCHLSANNADFYGPDRYWATLKLPLLSRWLVAVAKDRIAKAVDFRLGET